MIRMLHEYIGDEVCLLHCHYHYYISSLHKQSLKKYEPKKYVQSNADPPKGNL